MIRPAALAFTLLAFTAGAVAPAFAQDAGTDEAPAARKRTYGRHRATRKPVAAQPAAESAGEAAATPDAAEEPTPRGRRGAKGRSGQAKAPEAKAPPGLQATSIGTFGDWGAFAAGEGKTRICYAIAQPQSRLPKSLKRDPAYLFVTVRKAERVPNEVALMMGFAPKAPASQKTASATGGAPAATSAEPTLTIGSAKYTLVVKETNAWLQNPADETKVVAEMGRGRNVVVKAVSLRGNAATDEYGLTGFGDAIRKAREECK